MYDILVYNLDDTYLEEIRQLFSDERYSVKIVDNLEQAVETALQEMIDAALIWAASYEKTTDFLTVLNVNHLNYIPVVAVLNRSERLPELLNLPLADFIQLPLSQKEFFKILHQIFDHTEIQTTVVEGLNWQGSVQEYNLIDLIQMIETSARDAELSMTCGSRTGRIYFHRGKLIDAEFGKLKELDALMKMAFWPRGHFQTKLSKVKNTADKIGKSNRQILLYLVEKLLKQGELYEGLPALTEEVVKNPLIQPEGQLTSLQKRISAHCQTPISLIDLLLSLEDSNEDLLLELKIMMQMNLIGRRDDVEAYIQEEQKKSGLGRFFSSISAVFKKKDDDVEFNLRDEEPDGELLIPTITVPSVRLDETSLKKIAHKLESAS